MLSTTMCLHHVLWYCFNLQLELYAILFMITALYVRVISVKCWDVKFWKAWNTQEEKTVMKKVFVNVFLAEKKIKKMLSVVPWIDRYVSFVLVCIGLNLWMEMFYVRQCEWHMCENYAVTPPLCNWVGSDDICYVKLYIWINTYGYVVNKILISKHKVYFKTNGN